MAGGRQTARESLRSRINRQRRNRRRRMVLVFLIIFLFLSAASASYFAVSNFHHRAAQPQADGETLQAAENELTFLVLGVDRRESDTGRSDTLLLATVDPERKELSILSIPRDTRVKIEGYGYDKINHAYAYGGHELSRSTVEDLIGAGVDHYVLIDTHAFERIIDALGGIDLEVEKNMYYEDPWDDDGGLVIDITKGQQHLDGEKAIQYVRYRDAEGDIGRISRQQKFMRAVFDKVSSPGILIKLPGIVKEVSTAVESDLSIGQMISLLGMVKDVRENGVQTTMAPGRPAYIDEVSYWLPDIQELRQILATALHVEMSEEAKAAAQREAEEYENSIPQGMMIGEERPAAQQMEEMPETKENLPDVITVEIVNASGLDGAGARTKELLEKRGFVVSGISTLSAPYKQTTLVVHTEDKRLAERFSSLPFPHVVQTRLNGEDAGRVILILGRDYKKE